MDSIRVLTKRIDQESVQELLDALESSPRLVEEIVFFTSYYHTPLELDTISEFAGQISQVFPMIRQRGYRIGLNHLATTGHHEENLEMVANHELPRQVGLDGQSCQGAICMADAGVKEYVRETYRILALSQPDIIWVDDDVRLGGHIPTQGCCVCSGCLADFSEDAGEPFTRESLVAALDAPDASRRTRIRRLFLERNTRVIRDLLAIVEEAVHAVDPKIELGMMTGDRFWEGYGFEQWADALRGSEKSVVRWRPGGGFYGDDQPKELLDKAHAMGRQSAILPSYVQIIQSEIENFPYQNLRKAAQSNVLEITANLFAGCSGTALNILGQEGNSIAESASLLEKLKEATPFWNRLKSELEGSAPVGVWAAWDPLQISAGGSGEVSTIFSDIIENMCAPYVLAELGIPMCYGQQHGYLTGISGLMPKAIGREKMMAILAQGALLDADAVKALEEMGLAELTGVKVGSTYHSDTQEVFANHPLNKEYSSWTRDCRQSFKFWNVPARELLLTDPSTEVLSRLSDYQGRDRGAALSTFCNPLGGRVAVMSYFPWTMNMGLAKRQQMIALCDWLSGDRMPLRIETFARLTPWVRQHPDGSLVVGFLNLSGDTYERIDLTIRTSSATFQTIEANGALKPLSAQKCAEGYRLSLHQVQPYTFEVILSQTI